MVYWLGNTLPALGAISNGAVFDGVFRGSSLPSLWRHRGK